MRTDHDAIVATPRQVADADLASAANERARRGARGIARAIGWGMLGYALTHLGICSGTIARFAQQPWFGEPPGPGGLVPSVMIVTIFAEGVAALACGIITIRVPNLVFRMCCIVAALTLPHAAVQMSRLGYHFGHGVPAVVAMTFHYLLEPILGAAAIMSLWATRSLDLKLIAPLCQVCGYDLRASQSLTCPECGMHYTAAAFSRLPQRRFLLLARALGWWLLILGSTELGMNIDFIAGGIRYAAAGFDPAARVGQGIADFPSLDARFAAIIEGTLVFLLGVATVKRPRVALIACITALLLSAPLSTFQYIAEIKYLNSWPFGSSFFGPDFGPGHSIGWFFGDLRPVIVGLFVVAALSPIRRDFGVLQDAPQEQPRS